MKFGFLIFLSKVVLASEILTEGGSKTNQGRFAGLLPRTWNGEKYGCKCYLGDSCWPKAAQWTAFNASVAGNLQVDIPPGAVCYNVFQGPLGNVSTYDQAACQAASAGWMDEQWQ
jgi:hypothetical protein